jgi:lysophospholipase L1-like esterase
MSVTANNSQNTEYRILVKQGDEELARQDAAKAAISAEEARLSALDAGASEQVATQKAAQTVEDAASALASKQEAESAATDSGGFATDSGISATASNTAKLLSEAAKDISIEEAGKSSTSAGQSVASAAVAKASEAETVENATQTGLDAAAALASKNASESAAAAALASALAISLAQNIAFRGGATLATVPNLATGPQTWQATVSGTYTNMGGLVVNLSDGVIFLNYDGTTWRRSTTPIVLLADGVIESGNLKAVNGDKINFANNLLYNIIDNQTIAIDRLSDNESPLFFNAAEFIKSNSARLQDQFVSIINRNDDYNFTISLADISNYLEDRAYSIVIRNALGEHKVYVTKTVDRSTGVVTVDSVLPAALNSFSSTHFDAIHLSNYGYNAMAEAIYDSIERFDYKKNCIFNYMPLNCTQKSGGGLAAWDKNNTSILVADFKGINNPSTGGNMLDAIRPNVCRSESADANQENYNLYRRSYVVAQSKANTGVFLEIDLPRTTGFLKTFVGINRKQYFQPSTGSQVFTSGGCIVSCKDDKGIEFFTKTVYGSTEEINIAFTNQRKITIQFVTETAVPTIFNVSSIAVYPKRDALNTTAIADGSIVSFLGDSWTQFPVATQGETPPPKPSGQIIGNGMQYLSERFRSYALEKGNVIETINQGRGGMTSEYGRFWVDKQIINWEKKPDYCIILFSLNDYNSRNSFGVASVYDFQTLDPWSGDSPLKLGAVNMDRYIDNIKYISDKLLKAGIKPIIITPPIVSSAPFSSPFSDWASGLIDYFNENSEV